MLLAVIVLWLFCGLSSLQVFTLIKKTFFNGRSHACVGGIVFDSLISSIEIILYIAILCYTLFSFFSNYYDFLSLLRLLLWLRLLTLRLRSRATAI